jgi:hypothetical protein
MLYGMKKVLLTSIALIVFGWVLGWSIFTMK